MAKKEAKTNVMRMLEQAKINYIAHTYSTADGAIDGVSVAEKCGENPDSVFKTLVTIGADNNNYVFVIPVARELDLKLAAKSAGVKNISMLPLAKLLPTTGYIHGGCSPIGMKKPFPTYFDETIMERETIFVSGGRVGTQVELSPEDILKVTKGKTASLTVDR